MKSKTKTKTETTASESKTSTMAPHRCRLVVILSHPERNVNGCVRNVKWTS
jgi:hypothetical protein